MRIVLPGALPDPGQARELTSYLQKTAPTLLGWMERARARSIAADPAVTGCTPYEQWQLAACGFRPEAGQKLAAGLGPLWAQQNTPPDQPVWLLELVHVAPSRDGAALLPARELAITPEQSVALFESVQTLFSEAGFMLHADGAEHWRLDLPPEFAPDSASPALVAMTSVNDWWPQDMAGRPWRRLVNEVQMLWFDHPVNQDRYRQSLMPVNSLWLFGGARAAQLPGRLPLAGTQVHEGLLAPAIRQDWAAWLAVLGELESRVFRPMAQGAQPELVLTGRERIVELRPPALGKWTRWLPGSRNTWRNWWSPQS